MSIDPTSPDLHDRAEGRLRARPRLPVPAEPAAADAVAAAAAAAAVAVVETPNTSTPGVLPPNLLEPSGSPAVRTVRKVLHRLLAPVFFAQTRSTEEILSSLAELRRDTVELRRNMVELRRDTVELRRDTVELRHGTVELRQRTHELALTIGHIEAVLADISNRVLQQSRPSKGPTLDSRGANDSGTQ